MIEPYIETRSGIHFHFLDPKPEEINIADIGFALANQCRFNGHCHRFYSVAEHSVLVASLVPEEYKLAALLHDASEAYLSDIPSPIKQYLKEYKEMERNVQVTIDEKFNTLISDDEYLSIIKKADLQQLCTEAYNLLPSRGEDWVEVWKGNKPDFKDGRKPMCLAQSDAFGLFMSVFENLTEATKPRIIVEA